MVKEQVNKVQLNTGSLFTDIEAINYLKGVLFLSNGTTMLKDTLLRCYTEALHNNLRYSHLESLLGELVHTQKLFSNTDLTDAVFCAGIDCSMQIMPDMEDDEFTICSIHISEIHDEFMRKFLRNDVIIESFERLQHSKNSIYN